ncbi:MAG TPA: TIM barrel protein [Methylibium sp.]|uniref:hydroxypyruvate isomerase family protein n=1 Tax=Methylibium sp. TaxID=2067992 RepID=UPI002DBBBE56|nr:TIM barrel protein [Methylibium sp.]HEU4460521.1 TIM barrel protein [Methylibium sp.]
MPRFAANLSTLYPEHAFLDRAEAAARDGFAAVECQFPYEHGIERFRERLDATRLSLVLLNAPAGDWPRGERGFAAVPGREAEFRRSVEQGMDACERLGSPRLHLLAGCRAQGFDAAAHAAWQATYLANLEWAARRAEGRGLTLLIEPLNPRDVPGYFLSRQDHAHAIVAAVGAAHLQVQMDLYHCALVEGDLAAQLARWLPGGRVGHLQIAGVPARQEPDRGEVDFGGLFERIDALGWAGWVGCEYRPRAGTSEGLVWRERLGAQRQR